VLRLQFPQGFNNLSFNTIIHQSRNIVNGFSGKKEEESIDHEPTFAEQVDMVLDGKMPFYSGLLIRGDTPEILRSCGLDNLPMLYMQNHLRKAILPKTENEHTHGLTVEQIKKNAIPAFRTRNHSRFLKQK